ncbi:hypothetical protein CMUST_01995 [Corynebacterium mustelae]|uniref:Uncharacterized protein n=1 Tax=Corynebacterium mustelae TaxID=571915 RepID=A0A0G3GUC6_9CORY|nr:hypothetical protein [Corynebacterium mustelae]AKK04744.1 hypothetical protein CMUST_01995 [Corynebacterium mustelae]
MWQKVKSIAQWLGIVLFCVMLTTKTTGSFDYLWISAALFFFLAVPTFVEWVAKTRRAAQS